MKMTMGLLLLVGALMAVPVFTFAGEHCSTTNTTSAGEQIKKLALESDQRSSISF